MVSRNPLACIAPLFVPGDRPGRFIKAGLSGADAVLIDLEDAVPPVAKSQAREGLRALQPLAVPTFVRVNAPTTEWFGEDVEVVGFLPLAGIVVPKAESAGDLRGLRERLAPGQSIIALIETAEGLANVREIARADGALRLAFGSIDFCADLGCAHTREALLFARAEIVLASRSGNLLPPLDGVTAETKNPELVESDARHASDLGFGGKLCIHPRQIKPAFAGFAPLESQLAWAREVLAVPDLGAVALNNQMIDAPVRERARRILARERLGPRA
ncbi:HpcH/HpaI aldolase/citrate lyase family protein [Microvirga brassicacearum]|uniref:CoA ester lyase n=1 Tax=Microvirga brassicacearum TaxID=2580413 RepID=A0A5N3P5K1_9HYPH|nr:CoA ester lyase [Microvirga brassicacearum]KAB0265010.1 CoA ester lyase [Microvirga brassicacearum]